MELHILHFKGDWYRFNIGTRGDYSFMYMEEEKKILRNIDFFFPELKLFSEEKKGPQNIVQG